MKRKNTTTETYSFGNGFLVDIVEQKEEVETYEAWLYYEMSGIKSAMFAVLKNQPDGIVSHDEFVSMAKNGLENGTYIQEYTNDYLDEFEMQEK